MTKKSLRTIPARVLALALVFALIFTTVGLPLTAGANPSDGLVDDLFEIERMEFFEALEEHHAVDDLDIVHVDTSDIVHKPQEELELIEAEDALQEDADILPLSRANALTGDKGAGSYPISYGGPFVVNDTRPFKLTTATATAIERDYQGNLVASGTYSNIWVLDDADYHAKTKTTHTAACRLRDVNYELGNRIAVTLDGIYEAMTDPTSGFGPHANMLVATRYANLPQIGDFGSDGKVNYLLYDIDADGSSSNGYVAGFFYPGDFQPASYGGNHIDLLHIDIGNKQGYEMLTGTVEQQLGFFGVVAHELQHLLYFMHYGVYAPASGYQSDLWFNESLSELAGAFYVQPGTEIVDWDRMAFGSFNEYSDPSGRYRDFFNFRGMKNYGIGRLFSHVMYKAYGNYPRGVYAHFASSYPPALNVTQYRANQSSISTMDLAIGNALYAGTGVGVGGTDTLRKVYFLFMEAFVADGGMIEGDIPVQTSKVYGSARPIDNLWAVRQAAGYSGGRVYHSETLTGSSYPVASSPRIPMILRNGSISLRGYGTNNTGKGATHEMLYRIDGSGNSATPILTIRGIQTLADAKYYVVIPKDDVISTPGTHTSGVSGADVYPVKADTLNTINTHGRPTYLFISSFYQNISVVADFSWAAAQSSDFVGKVSLLPRVPRPGNTLTASVSPAGSYSYQWTSGGVPVGTNSASYVVQPSDVGAIIRVSVTSTGKTGAITAQTPPVARPESTSIPVAPVLASKTQTRVSLISVAGYEYSNGGVFWQDSPTFENLLPATRYTFYQRIKASATVAASQNSGALSVTTDAPARILTTTRVTTAPASPSFGTSVTLTARVQRVYGSGNPTGTVQFKVGGKNHGSPVALSAGAATLKTTTLGGGKQAITAVYSGAANFEPSTSEAASLTIKRVKGTPVNTPKLDKRNSVSVTVKKPTFKSTNVGKQTIEYAISKKKTAPTTGWQDSLTFNKLSSNTQYYVFARSKANNNCTAGAVSTPLAVKTPKSSNANLKALKPSVGTFTKPFVKSRVSYAVTVPRTTSSVKVTASKEHAGAKLEFRVNGTWKVANSQTVSPKRGESITVRMRVTAQNGTTVKTYSAKVTRAK